MIEITVESVDREHTEPETIRFDCGLKLQQNT
jgi:hypothetical protein